MNFSYRLQTADRGSIYKSNTTVDETLELKLARMMTTQEPIEGTAPLTYQERQEGVNAAYNIRSDRWEIALEAKEAVEKSYAAKREMRIGERTYDTMTDEQKGEFHKKYPNNKYAPKTTETPQNTDNR